MTEEGWNNSPLEEVTLFSFSDFECFEERELRAYVVGVGRVLFLRLLKTGRDKEQKEILDELGSLIEAIKSRVEARLSFKQKSQSTEVSNSETQRTDDAEMVEKKGA